MEIPPPFQQIAADPKFIDQIVNQIKSQGTFDQWRRECLADVDTKPAYQNLTFRVDSAVAAFLGKQRWRPDMVKNQVRENLRKHILELGLIDKGVDRIVQQVVQPKVLPIFHPEVENAIYNFLGIENPRARNGTQPTETSTTVSPRKAFRPMPVSVPCRDKEDCTPPPGEEFDLEAITPSSESRCGSSLKRDLADEMSDVSMEDSRPPPEAGLERICSPISPQSSSDRVEDTETTARNRVGSALSAISSGDDVPSASPAAASPVTSDEFHDNNNPPQEEQPRQESPASSDDENDEDDDDEDDFSSPEFEKLEINAPPSRTVTPVPGEEDASQDKQEIVPVVDDHYKWRPKTEGRDPDRKPDEDPGNLGSRKLGGESAGQLSRNQPTESGSSQPSGEVVISDSKSAAVTASTSESTETDKNTKEKLTERSVSSSSKDRSRSQSESHKSDRRDKSRKDKDREKDRDRQKDRDREKRREREKREESERRSKSHHSKSSHKDRDEKKKSHRDKDRDRQREKERDRNRSKSSHEGERSRSLSYRDKERKSIVQAAAEKGRNEGSPSPSPFSHPKAYLWKRPAEEPTALRNYLARLPEEIFDETYDGITGLSDVSASSVSSYDDSDADSTILLYLSEIEIDSEVEEAVADAGGRVIYQNVPHVEECKDREEEVLESDYTPASDEFARSESCLRDQQLNINNNKRVRKLNTRYSDSYVGSELRKIITTSTEHPQRSPRMNNNIKSQQPRENQENCIEESSPEEIQVKEEMLEYAPPDAKRLKADQPLPSSPESVQSDLTHLPHAQPSTPPSADIQSATEEDVIKEVISPNGRRRTVS